MKKVIGIIAIIVAVIAAVVGVYLYQTRWPSGDALRPGHSYYIYPRYYTISPTTSQGAAWDLGTGESSNPDPFYTLQQAKLTLDKSAKTDDRLVVDGTPIKANRFSVSFSDYFHVGQPEVLTIKTITLSEGTITTPLTVTFYDDDSLKNDVIATFVIPFDTLVEGDNEIDCTGQGLNRLVIRVVDANVSQARLMTRLRAPIEAEN